MSAGISYAEEVRRKLVHLSSLWMVAAILLLPRGIMIGVFAFLLAGNLVIERLRSGRAAYVTPAYDFFFGRMLRKEPEPGQWIISGGPYVFAAALAVTVFAPASVAAAAMAVMLLGDTAAALAGRKWGRHKIVNGKSLEGCAVFLIAGTAGALILTGGAHPWMVFCGVLAGCLAELFEKQTRVDDNLAIPAVFVLVWRIFAFGGWL